MDKNFIERDFVNGVESYTNKKITISSIHCLYLVRIKFCTGDNHEPADQISSQWHSV